VSDEELVLRVGSSLAYLNQLRTGFRAPGKNFIARFSEAFGVSTTEMYRQDGSPAPAIPPPLPKVVFVEKPVPIGIIGVSAIPVYCCSGRGTVVHGLPLHFSGETTVIPMVLKDEFAVDADMGNLAPKGEARKRDILVLSPSKPVSNGSLVLCAPYGYVDLARYVVRGDDAVLIPNGSGKPYVVPRQSLQGKMCVVTMVLHRPGRRMDLVIAHSGVAGGPGEQG